MVEIPFAEEDNETDGPSLVLNWNPQSVANTEITGLNFSLREFLFKLESLFYHFIEWLLVIREDPSGEEREIRVPKDVGQYELTDLIPGTQYTIKLFALLEPNNKVLVSNPYPKKHILSLII